MREYISLIEANTRPAKLETNPLPFNPKDLSPVLSKDSIEYHYEHLAKDYAKRYNAEIGNPHFNRAGNFLHNTFFAQLRAPKLPNKPRNKALELIESKFNDWETFKEKFTDAATTIQGSGWVYLSTGGEIKTISNHAVRTDIALLLDMWEHAYALDYRWDKASYVKEFWKIVNWDVINERL